MHFGQLAFSWDMAGPTYFQMSFDFIMMQHLKIKCDVNIGGLIHDVIWL